MRRFLVFLLLLAAAVLPVRAQIAVRGDTVHTVSGPAIADGVVLVRDGRIERVGRASDVPVPEGYRVLRAAVVTPGLVDAHSVVGLGGILNQPHDQEQLETSNPIQPGLRAIDAYNARDPLVAWLRDFGVTTVHTGHGPGALISGGTMIVKTHGETIGEALVDSLTMLAATVGASVERSFRSPGSRAKGVAMLRAELLKARKYADDAAAEDPADRPSRDLSMEPLARVVAGEIPLLVTAQTSADILTALRLRDEFGFTLVLDGAGEAHLVLDELQAAGVPVIVHPTMARVGGEMKNASMETAAALHGAGIPFAFQSGQESYVPKTRVVLFEAALAAANGLPRAAALEAVTLGAARLVGVDGRVGSIEPGKDADLVLFDGDPFEYTTHVCAVLIDGVVVSESCK